MTGESEVQYEKYEVTIYRKYYSSSRMIHHTLWDYEWYEKIVEGESFEEVEKYVCAYLRNMYDFYIKIEEHI